MGRRMLAVIVAAVVALVGVLFVLLYARSADDRAVADASPRTVYVSTQLVPAGTSLREALRLDLVTQTRTAAKAVPEGALTTVDEENASLLAIDDIDPGQYLLTRAFGETPTADRKIQVPTGKLAVSVQLTDPARVGSFVTLGTYVTIFATYPTPTSSAQGDASGGTAVRDPHSTSVLLDKVQVIGVGDTALAGTSAATGPADDGSDTGGAGDQGASQTFLVTLAVTPEQATRLVHAVNRYILYAGLHGSDVEVGPDLSTDDLSIFGGPG